MADALKAEGNKAFAAKNFEEAAYVQTNVTSKKCTNGRSSLARNSHKLSSLTQQIMSFTRIALAHMLPSDSSTKRWKMLIRPLN
jgi:hypothetical protein